MSSLDPIEACLSGMQALDRKIDQLTLALGMMKDQLSDVLARQAITGLHWRSLAVELPLFDEHERVLIYTEGVDFNGEQIFDVPAIELWHAHSDHEGEEPHEVLLAATHWCAYNRPAPALETKVPRANGSDPLLTA